MSTVRCCNLPVPASSAPTLVCAYPELPTKLATLSRYIKAVHIILVVNDTSSRRSQVMPYSAYPELFRSFSGSMLPSPTDHPSITSRSRRVHLRPHSHMLTSKIRRCHVDRSNLNSLRARPLPSKNLSVTGLSKTVA